MQFYANFSCGCSLSNVFIMLEVCGIENGLLFITTYICLSFINQVILGDLMAIRILATACAIIITLILTLDPIQFSRMVDVF